MKKFICLFITIFSLGFGSQVLAGACWLLSQKAGEEDKNVYLNDIVWRSSPNHQVICSYGEGNDPKYDVSYEVKEEKLGGVKKPDEEGATGWVRSDTTSATCKVATMKYGDERGKELNESCRWQD